MSVPTQQQTPTHPHPHLPARRWDVYFCGPRTVDPLAFVTWYENDPDIYLYFTGSPVSMRPSADARDSAPRKRAR